ncbi:MAG: hypothetical protein KAT65_08710 [Methanophagales archaeon]|nr:hypothetical protein [Methanophagales archaeon]
MLKKVVITYLILCCTIGAITFTSGCVEQEIGKQKIESLDFSLKSWKVIDDKGAPSLIISFYASNDFRLQITDPNGIETGGKYIETGITGAKLRLARYNENPQAGVYKLIVKERHGNIIFTKEISFAGANVSILKCTSFWKYSEWSGEYTLKSLTISVKNNGDLPAYMYNAEVSIGGKVSSIRLSEVVLPNQEKTITKDTYIRDIPPGKYEMTVTLEDSSGNVISTYTTEEVPSK